ncbi:transposase [Actinosynnema mirum]|uniref:transposase n=1 Tax=Actinosynnema mirum TaxID=40567 RepID=UPI00019AB910|nr:transposase [Actinosynnema mirum]
MEDRLCALGLGLNAIVLFTTRHLDAATTELRAGGHEVREEDAARLSPFVRHHVNLLGRYSFLLAEVFAGRPAALMRRDATVRRTPMPEAGGAPGTGAGAVTCPRGTRLGPAPRG